MDPVTIFGLAVNIITVIESSIKAVEYCRQMRKIGMTVGNHETITISQSLGEFIRSRYSSDYCL